LLTITRILLTPLFVILLLKHLFLYALLVFTLAGISDALDGILARYCNQRTALGAYLDPIADKLLLASAFVILAVLEIIPGWLTVIVLTRDILIVIGFVIFAIRAIKVEIKPSVASKLTTLTQLLAVFFALLQPGSSSGFITHYTLYWLAALLTIISGLHYIYIGLNILQNFPENNQPPKQPTTA
jgi:cardiolipin synthase